MVDNKDIGARIKKCRLEKDLTQGRLAEAVGVGVTHISHIEKGTTVPSLPVFIKIANALECSADELLCIEVADAHPIFTSWLTELVEDCSSTEIKLITDMVISLKNSMRRLHIDEEP